MVLLPPRNWFILCLQRVTCRHLTAEVARFSLRVFLTYSHLPPQLSCSTARVPAGVGLSLATFSLEIGKALTHEEVKDEV